VRGEVALGGCIIEPGQPDLACSACGHEWLSAKVEVEPEEVVEELGRPHSFWMVGETEERGAFVDWDGRALLLRFCPSGIVVDAHAGFSGWYEGAVGDAEDGAELQEGIGIDLGAAVLLYREADERAWLRMPAHPSLPEACQHVAALAPVVARALEREFDFDRTPPGFEELFAE